MTARDLRIEDLSEAGDDTVTALTDLVNEVYSSSEKGLWTEGAARTTPAELAGLVRAGQISVARLDGHLAGCVRVRRVDTSASEFGMLATAPEYQGLGVGRALITHAERRAQGEGSRLMRLELIVPSEWPHPSKEFLAAWYGRLGYHPTRTHAVADSHPDLVTWLATPCHVVVYEKRLS
jgi:GNAT superfamily N-acetyltransferase